MLGLALSPFQMEYAAFAHIHLRAFSNRLPFHGHPDDLLEVGRCHWGLYRIARTIQPSRGSNVRQYGTH